jgi:hypothetical protein
MPLMSVARPAKLDRALRSIRFAMTDGSKMVFVLVSNTALEDIEVWPPDDGGCLKRFKQSRKGFEQIASAKYDRGHVEADGTVCIRSLDLPPLAINRRHVGPIDACQLSGRRSRLCW